MGRTTALITLPNAKNFRSPRELVQDFVKLFGTADPELLEHEGKAFTAGGNHYNVDVHGHSLSVYNGTGPRRQTAHDVIVRKTADIMAFAGLQGVDVEDASAFKCCISSTARRQRYLQQIGRHTTGHGILRRGNILTARACMKQNFRYLSWQGYLMALILAAALQVLHSI